MNPISVHEDEGSIPSLTQWVKDPKLLWLWCRLAAVAPIRPPSLGTSICHGYSPKKTKDQKKKKKKNNVSISTTLDVFLFLQ